VHLVFLQSFPHQNFVYLGKQEEHIEEFKQLKIENQKQHLAKIFTG
jgi:hypothetical protein